jgi:5-histidylcysteine sulfoxide synthase
MPSQTSTSTAAHSYSDDSLLVTENILLNEGDIETKRREILEYFHKSFTLYETLFECLNGEEAFYVRANPLRHPLIFYYGHTSAFFINKLNDAGLISERVDAKMEHTLAIGVDEMSWDDLDGNNYDWPTPEEVKAHRDKTRKIVDNYIRNCDFTLPIGWDSPMWIIMMGIEHERIHIETTAVLLRELPLDMVRSHPIWSNISRESGQAPENELLFVEGGSVTLGKSKDSPFYGWDNEYGHYEAEVSPFRASKYLVSNKEFLEFVEDNGYAREEYWSDEGWDWVQHSKAQYPVCWIKDGNNYKYRTMLEVIDLPCDWPVDINYHEAKAFCNWKSAQTKKHIRMPTEAEWHKLHTLVDTAQPYPSGNINLAQVMSPCPVTRNKFAEDFHDITGNVWQWTETLHEPFEGYKNHTAYPDYSLHFFDQEHNILCGGCWVSSGQYATTARNWFRRHFFQYAGLRYISPSQ